MVENNKEQVDTLQDDNIYESDIDDAVLNQFIKEMEIATPVNRPSIADLYMSNLSSSKRPNSSYYDEFDNVDVIAQASDPMQVTKNMLSTGSVQYWGKNDNKYSSNSKAESSVFEYVGDSDESDDITKILDDISTQMDNIYDCTKSTGQMVDEVYTNQITLSHVVDDMAEFNQSNTNRLEKNRV